MNNILSDLDDFLAPSLECIKMVPTPGQKVMKPGGGDEQPTSKIMIGNDMEMEDEFKVELHKQQRPDLIKKSTQNTAKISLQDCLACSGCVTSAETVLIQQHSIDEFLKLFTPENKVFVAISPQAISSLSFYFHLDDLTTFRKLQTVFKQVGASAVLDLSLFNSIALNLSYLEWRERYMSSAKRDPERISKIKKSLKWNREVGYLPILSSECPGWVCYAEKQVGEEAFPFMSKVKSPQQLCGRLLKTQQIWAGQESAQAIKFVTVMPCYDKKLEAVRPTLLTKSSKNEDEFQPVMEVDTVLATHELLELFEKCNIDFKSVEPSTVPPSVANDVVSEILARSESADKFIVNNLYNRQSNGYLEYIMRRAAKDIFGLTSLQESDELAYLQGKNKDLKEVILPGPDGKPLLKFA